MRMSNNFFITRKEFPNDEDCISAKLLIKSGMIYKNESELISLIKKCGDNRIIENYSKKSFNYIENEWKNKNYASKLMELYCNILNES